jgi:hypothetical protein
MVVEVSDYPDLWVFKSPGWDGGADSLELFSRGYVWKRLCLPFGKETLSLTSSALRRRFWKEFPSFVKTTQLVIEKSGN